jgi:hypothetical protein
LPRFSAASAGAYLLAPECSGWLSAWWLALHVVLAASILLICPWPALTGPALALLAARAWRRRPRRPPLIVHSPGASPGRGAVQTPGGHWALPQAGRFGLTLSPATRCGGVWVELVFNEPAAPRILLLRDQFCASTWRRLRLALIEPGRTAN